MTPWLRIFFLKSKTNFMKKFKLKNDFKWSKLNLCFSDPLKTHLSIDFLFQHVSAVTWAVLHSLYVSTCPVCYTGGPLRVEQNRVRCCQSRNHWLPHGWDFLKCHFFFLIAFIFLPFERLAQFSFIRLLENTTQKARIGLGYITAWM